MSSSRSLASARNKRAGGNTPSSSTPVPTSSSSTNNSSVQPKPEQSKLSYQQAMTMMMGKINTLELFMETTREVIEDIKSFHTNIQNKYVIDENVFNSIVSRIETLEKGSDESTPITTLLDNYSRQQPTQTSDMNKEIDELKSGLIRLQTFVMETNSKLCDIVFTSQEKTQLGFEEVFSDSDELNQVSFDSTRVNTLIAPPTLVRNQYYPGSKPDIETNDVSRITNLISENGALKIDINTGDSSETSSVNLGN